MRESGPSLTLSAELACLPSAIDFARRGAQSADLPADCWGQLELVVEELFVNVVSYAYEEEIPGVVEMTFSVVRPGLLSFEIADRGLEYDPLTLREPNLPMTLDERKVGGLGVFLVRQLTESLDYRRDGDWNRLRFGFSASSTAVRHE